MNKCANAIDLELDLFQNIIEIGITEIKLETLEITKTASYPIKPPLKGFKINRQIEELTGWNESKLHRQGLPLSNALESLSVNWGIKNRLVIVDSIDEIRTIQNNCKGPSIRYYNLFSNMNSINIASLFNIATGQLENSVSLENMLIAVGTEFQGKAHRASIDSRNIAELFIRLMKRMKNGNNH